MWSLSAADCTRQSAIELVFAQDSSKMMNPSGRPGPKHEADEDEEDDDDEEDAVGPWDKEYGDGEGDPCPNCGRVYRFDLVVDAGAHF